MTYTEAVVFRDKHIELLDNYSDFLTHKIECLLIAPDDIHTDEITTVYNQTILDNDNETALQNLGFFNGTMNVYVIWEPVKRQIEQMTLAAYLAAVK